MHMAFVYGTLKKGFPNNYLLEDASNGVQKFLGNAVTVEQYPFVIAGRFSNPYVLDAAGKGKPVHGEVYEVDDQMLETLDRLEGHPYYYQRDDVEVRMLTQGEEDVSHANITKKCGIYFLRNFKEELLGMEMHSNYEGVPKYVPPSDRDPEETAKGPLDVMKHYSGATDEKEMG